MFWEAFWPQFVATVIGLIIGIPIALWLNSYQERNTEKEQKEKILRLLTQELFMNFGELAKWKREKDIRRVYTLNVFLKTEIWDAFADGGELKWIKSPELLGNIAEAYNFIRMMKEFSNRYLELTQFNQDVNIIREAAAERVFELLDTSISESMNEVSKALNNISEARIKKPIGNVPDGEDNTG